MSNLAECSNHLKTLKNNGYHMTVAARIFKTDEAIFLVDGAELDQPTVYTIQVGTDRHRLTTYGMYVNHSCHPNSYFDVENLVFRALQMINVGEEITFNYCTTEYDMSRPFQCHCGAVDCLGYIRGYKHLPAKHRERLSLWVPDYLKLAEKIA